MRIFLPGYIYLKNMFLIRVIFLRAKDPFVYTLCIEERRFGTMFTKAIDYNQELSLLTTAETYNISEQALYCFELTNEKKL